jgi:CubicO group peptidase (beta-lactamase class C family)
MTQGMQNGPAIDERLERVWSVPDEQVASGRIPGYVAAIRIGGQTRFHAGGRMTVDPDGKPMRADTLFRIASVTKPMGGALTLSLVQDGVLDLDDPIARWLPEAATPRVLASPDAPMDRTVEARRPVTVRHLLTCTSGWGVGIEGTRVRRAMMDLGVHPGPMPLSISGDEFVARVTSLPLSFQPGEGWLYDTGIDLLGVLLERATGGPLSDLFAECITGPLKMTSTGFWALDRDRLAAAYMPAPNGLELLDPADGLYSRPPVFEELSGGLVSTASDVLRFYAAMADGGAPVLTRDSLALMATDALTPEQRRHGEAFLGPGASWSLGTGVDLEAAEPWMAPGRWGWDGGTGTTAYVDPTRRTVGVLLTQRAMTGPDDGFGTVWTAVAEAAA